MKADTNFFADYLSRSEALLEGLHLGGVGVWRWRIDSRELMWTDNLEAVHDLPRGAFDGTLASFERDVHPDDFPAVWAAIGRSIETGENYRAVYRTAPRPGADPIWIETRGGVVADADGHRHLTGVCLDVTERVQSERELQRRLRQQKAIERFGSFALMEDGFQRVLDRAVQVATDVLDVPMAKILRFENSADRLLLCAGVGWREGLVGNVSVGIESGSQAGYTLLSSEPVVVHDLLTETRFGGPTLLHEHGVRSGMSAIISGSDSRPFGVFGVHTRELRQFDQADVDFLIAMSNIVANSARHLAAAEQRSLLMREMAHRAGNMLQLVSTIAGQTFSGRDNIEDARHAFSERLGSLSRANHLIARGGWTATRLRALVEETLQPFGERVALQGRDILLPPELSFDLGLVLHELATNSVKYGSLGSEEGQVKLAWTLRQDEGGMNLFHFVWDDPLGSANGSAVGTGFGSKLLAALIQRKWGGEIETDAGSGYRFAATMRFDN